MLEESEFRNTVLQNAISLQFLLLSSQSLQSTSAKSDYTKRDSSIKTTLCFILLSLQSAFAKVLLPKAFFFCFSKTA
jgi:hypothetical protein